MRALHLASAATRAAFTAIVCGFLCTPAGSADLYKAPVSKASESIFNWTGMQVYGYGEYGANLSAVDVSAAGGFLSLNGANVEHGPGVGGGLELLYQATNVDWVLGVRAEMSYLNMRGTSSLTMGPATLSVSNATNVVGDASVVLGYTIAPRLLGYVDGGLAWGVNKPNLSVGSVAAAASDTSLGWRAGLGLDYALTPNWLIGIEGSYTRLGDKSLNLGGGVVTSNNPLSAYEQRLKVGYKF